jgi:hypothetical protein
MKTSQGIFSDQGGTCGVPALRAILTQALSTHAGNPPVPFMVFPAEEKPEGGSVYGRCYHEAAA